MTRKALVPAIVRRMGIQSTPRQAAGSAARGQSLPELRSAKCHVCNQTVEYWESSGRVRMHGRRGKPCEGGGNKYDAAPKSKPAEAPPKPNKKPRRTFIRTVSGGAPGLGRRS